MKTRSIQITDEAVAKYKDASIDDALLQAIYNGIDAEANEIKVNALSRKGETLDVGDDNDTIAEIQIVDNGTGIPFDTIDKVFRPLERSWKKGIQPKNRAAYHGEKGCGRFKCFALGEELTWKTVFRGKNNQLLEYSMKLDVSSPKNLEVDDAPIPSKASRTGTVLTIKALTPKFYNQYRTMASLRLDVLEGLLLDIEVYKNSIWLFGERLDPEVIKDDETSFEYSCQVSNTLRLSGTVRALAWKDDAQFVSHKHSFYYDGTGRFLAKRPSGLYADTHFPPHTLIITAQGLETWSALESDFGPFAKIEKAIRDHVVRFLVTVKKSTFSDLLNQLFANEDYPFKKPAKTPLDEAKTTAYNAVLGALAFDNPSVVAPKKKAILKMVFPLLDKLMSGDALLGENVDRLLELGDEHSKKFNRVFSRIQLSSILDRYNRLQHRYAFLKTLDQLVHVDRYVDLLLERAQLHKIVEQEPWIFGPDYEQPNLITSDQSLVTLLRQQITRPDLFFDTPPDRQKLQEIETFIEANKSNVKQCLTKIPDLVLAKTVKTRPGEDARQFLIVELKRPSVQIDKKCREQAMKVFTGVLAGTNGGGLSIDAQHRWRYCLVSSGIDPELNSEFGKNGHLEEKMGGDYVVDVLLWSTIIEQARQRLDEEMHGIEVEIKDPDCQELLAEYAKLFGVNPVISDLESENE